MAFRDDIAAIWADAGGDKRGREARLKAQRMRTLLINNLPFTWQPRAQVSVIIKDVTLRGNAIEFEIDVTIRGVTRSLSEWVEGRRSLPDWRIVNPPLFTDDPLGDVETPVIGDGEPAIRRGRDDLVGAMRQVFADEFGARIAALLRGAR